MTGGFVQARRQVIGQLTGETMSTKRTCITGLAVALMACSGDATGPQSPSRSGELLGSWNYSADFTVVITASTDTLRCTMTNARLDVTGPLRPDAGTRTWPYWADGTIGAGTLDCSSAMTPAFSTSVAGVAITSWRAILAAGFRFEITTPIGPIAINNNSCSCSSSDVLEPNRIEGTMSGIITAGGFSGFLRTGTFTARRVE